GDRLGLGLEALEGGGAVSQLAFQDFQGHFAFQRNLLRQVNVAHTPVAQPSYYMKITQRLAREIGVGSSGNDSRRLGRRGRSFDAWLHDARLLIPRLHIPGEYTLYCRSPGTETCCPAKNRATGSASPERLPPCRSRRLDHPGSAITVRCGPPLPQPASDHRD